MVWLENSVFFLPNKLKKGHFFWNFGWNYNFYLEDTLFYHKFFWIVSVKGLWLDPLLLDE